MLKQTKINRWSCLPTAFANYLDMDVNRFIELIGHDGSEIVFPGEYPWRAFHIQEIIDVLFTLNKRVTIIEKAVVSEAQGKMYRPIKDEEQRFNDYLNLYSGVLTGLSWNNTPHAVCWDHLNHIIHDYNVTYSIRCFKPEALYVISDAKPL